MSGSSAIPGPGSGSGPGSSGMAWTASGSVSALACFAGWLLALLFSVGPAHSGQLVMPLKFCSVKKIAKQFTSAASQDLLCMCCP